MLLVLGLLLLFFFFKQKTAYEMRISDWSSDVCSSDLEDEGGLFCFAMERPEGPPENSSPQALRGRAVCWPIALSKAGARFSPTWDQPSDADDGAPAACILLAAYAASAMKRATSCGAICTRAAAWRLSRPAKRRSSLKSPRLGDTTTASIPAAFARSIRVAIAPSPAGSLSRAM